MKIPLAWLKDFVDIKMRPEELAERLTMAGLEVGAIEYHGSGVEGVVVGKVKSVDKLPSDHHLICQIDIGPRIVQVISEDMSVGIGDKVPVALEGATLSTGIKIKKTELHGVEAFGCLCRPHELGLAQEETVLKLPLDAKLGEDVRKYLGTGGCVIDVDVLPNRGDCMSVLGVAREVSAVLKTKLKNPKIKTLNPKQARSSKFKVEVKDAKSCPRYMAMMIEGVKVAESPEWLKDRLLLAGLRPINNIVDVTNYLLLELGQPMHAFDADKLKGSKVIIRKAQAGEKITTLDKVERKLNKENLVIADAERAIALAGVMGGANTEVGPATRNVLLESAYFDPVSISRTSKDVKLRSEASIRFEKGVDWNMVEEAMLRAAQMIAEFGGGTIVPAKVDEKESAIKERTLVLRQERLDRILGIHIPIKEAAIILERLGFIKVKLQTSNLKIKVPSWRIGDVEREIDLIEEVARLNGYDKVRTTMPQVREREVLENRNYLAAGRARDILAGCGFYEIYTFTLVDPKMADKNAVVVANPLTVEESVMRTSMLPSVLKVVSHNLRHQIDELRIFEVGKVFLGREEKDVLAGAVIGEKEDFFTLKNAVENVLLEFFPELKYETLMGETFHPGKSAATLAGAKNIFAAKFGELHPEVLKQADIKKRVLYFEIDLNALAANLKPAKRFRPLPRFPKVERDISLIVPAEVASAQIIGSIKKTGGELVEEVFLFDIFKDSQAYRIAFRDKNKTLTDNEVGQAFEKIIQELTGQLKVQIRK